MFWYLVCQNNIVNLRSFPFVDLSVENVTNFGAIYKVSYFLMSFSLKATLCIWYKKLVPSVFFGSHTISGTGLNLMLCKITLQADAKRRKVPIFYICIMRLACACVCSYLCGVFLLHSCENVILTCSCQILMK